MVKGWKQMRQIAARIVVFLVLAATVGQAPDIRKPYASYLLLQRHVSDGALTSADHARVDYVFRSPEQRAAAKQALDLFLEEADPATRQALLKGLRRALVCLDSEPDMLYEAIRHRLDRYMLSPEDVTNSRRGGAWHWFDVTQASLIAYERTRQPRFLRIVADSYDKLLQVRDSALDIRDDLRGRALHSWGSNLEVETEDGQTLTIHTNEVTVAGLRTLPAAQLLYLVQRDDLGEFADLKQRFLASIELAVREFDADLHTVPGTSRMYYIMPHDGRVEPLNHSSFLGSVFCYLYDYTRDEHYLTRAQGLALYFAASLTREESGGYAWGYRPTPDNMRDHPAEPIWKGANTVTLPLTAHRFGIVFDDADMEAFARTFTRNIALEELQFNMYVSDLNQKEPAHLVQWLERPDLHSRVYALFRWILLAEFDPTIETILVEAMADRSDLFARGWFATPRAMVAYAWRLQPGYSSDSASIECLDHR